MKSCKVVKLRLIHKCCAVPMPFSSRFPAMPCRVNSNMPFRAQAVPMPFPCHAMSRLHTPFRAPAIHRQCCVHRESPRGSRKRPNTGRSPTCRLWTADASSHAMPCPCSTPAALYRGPDKLLSERHGRGMACVNQTRPHCVN
jgi:hypothetical protein